VYPVQIFGDMQHVWISKSHLLTKGHEEDRPLP